MIRHRLRWVMLVLAACCVIEAAIEASRYFGGMARQETEALQTGRAEVDRAASATERLVAGLRQTATDLADEINTGEVPHREIPKRLQEALSLDAKLFGIGIAFHPLTDDPQIRLHAPFYSSRERIGSIDNDDLLEVANAPIYQTDPQGNRITVGKVWVDITRRSVQHELDAVGIGRRGFSFLLSRDGRYLLHPRRELVTTGRTLFELAVEQDTPGLVTLGNSVIRGVPAFVDLKSGQSGQSLFAFSAPVPATGWSVGAAYLKEPLLRPTLEMQRAFYRMIVVLVLLTIVVISLRLVRPNADLDDDGWSVSLGSSLVLAFGVAALWWFTLQFGEYLSATEIPVQESSLLARMQNEHRAQCRQIGRPEPIFVPTGIYIQAIEFQSAINVKVTGYIWQRWPATFPETLEPGLVFPESQEGSLEQVYQSEEGGQRVVGWTFQTVVRQSFSYTTYPFDLQSVWLRMWPKQMTGPVVLVPDFVSYQSMNPQFTPGINKDLVLPGWLVTGSHFSFSPFQANTDFGLSMRRGGADMPELRYNIVIRREFLDAFISCILPIFVVIILVFAVLFIHTKDQSIAGRVGFSSSVTVQVSAALFFVVLFAQVDLRRRLEIEQIMYMDFYYFLTYLVFLIVSIDSIAFGWTSRVAWLEHRNNLVPKLLYWPTIMFVLFLTTAWFFYP